jgi:hypothetical protein
LEIREKGFIERCFFSTVYAVAAVPPSFDDLCFGCPASMGKTVEREK